LNENDIEVLSGSKKNINPKNKRQSNIINNQPRQGTSGSIMGQTGKNFLNFVGIRSNVIEGPKEGIIAHKMRLNSQVTTYPETVKQNHIKINEIYEVPQD
jgi:hypothetical protein